MSDVKQSNVPYLDGWRGLAVLLLLIGHFLPIDGLDAGLAGVNLFFVLSGMLMARILFVQRVPIRTFYRRRVARIFPAMYVFMIVVACGYYFSNATLDFSQIAAAASLTNNYFRPPAPPAQMPFGHFWSLCIEEQSYVLLTLFALLCRANLSRPKVVVATTCLLFLGFTIAYRSLYVGSRLTYELWPHFEVSAYAIFASVFFLLMIYGRTAKPPAIIVPLLFIIGLCSHWWSVSMLQRTFFGITALALCVNLLDSAPGLMKRALSIYPLRLLGAWSYSIYLWQQLFYRNFEGGVSGVVGILLSVTAGAISFYLVEGPIREHLNRKWGNRVDGLGATAPTS